VAVNTMSRTTRLSEAQARALADWWGGSLQQIIGLDQTGETWYGVVLPGTARENQEMPLFQELAVFSLEEARSLEKLRDVNNPNSPDWVG